MKYFVTCIVAIILCLVISPVFAQDFDPVGTGVVTQQISGTVSPENPAPGQTVTISLSGYGINLNAASISWLVNGSVVQKGTGLTQFSLTAGKLGEVKKVTAVITPTTGPQVQKSFSVSPQEVSLIYESDGYIPAFYKGKGYYAKEGTVTLVAVPNLISAAGARLNPNNLVYTWSVDSTVQGSMSGYGKNSFVYTGTILAKDVLVKVEVSTPDKSTTGVAVIALIPLEPEVLFYEQSPLYGTLLNKELGANGFDLQSKEITLSTIPYSTSASSLSDGTLNYTWSLNGDTIPTPKTQSYATFRNTTGEKGSSLIGVSVSNTTHLLQMMRNSLSINF